ncbi:MAG: OmpA family protein [Nitrospirales bacterium]|nr:OmpA family protein [Nitrospirales bacterium]
MNQILKRSIEGALIGSAIFTLMTACESPKHTTMISGETLETAQKSTPTPTLPAENEMPLSNEKFGQTSLDSGFSQKNIPKEGPGAMTASPEMPPQPSHPSDNQETRDNFFDGGPKPEEASSQSTFSHSTPSFPAEPSIQTSPPSGSPNVAPLQFVPELPPEVSENPEEAPSSQDIDMTPTRRHSDFVQKQPPMTKDQPSGQIVSPSEPPERSVAPLIPSDAHLAPVYFDYDQYALKPETTTILEANATLLKTTYHNVPILIEGHCDERGTQAYNMVLGKRRALAVKKYLVDLGISASQLTIVSYGEDHPSCTEHEASCWRQNRRAHFVPSLKALGERP